MDNVTLDDLRSYLDLRTAIRSLRDEIDTIEQGTYRPYDLIGSKRSRGHRSDPTARKALKLIEVRERLQRQLDEYEQITDTIERWTLTIDDQIVAHSVRQHYLNGRSWAQTGRLLYGSPSAGDSCRMAVQRYFEKVEVSEAGTDISTNL